MDLLTAIGHEVLVYHRQMYADLTVSLASYVDGTGSLAALASGALLMGMVHALTPGHGKAILFAHFVGRQAHPLAGFAAAAQVAVLHVTSGALLVAIVGSAAYVFGRPTGAASTLQTLSAIAVIAAGLWALWRAFSRRQHHLTDHTSLALAVGLLPCPLTMLLISTTYGRIGGPATAVLVGFMAVGILMTIGLVGTGGLLVQRSVRAASFGHYTRLLASLEVVAALVIVSLGCFVLFST